MENEIRKKTPPAKTSDPYTFRLQVDQQFRQEDGNTTKENRSILSEKRGCPCDQFLISSFFKKNEERKCEQGKNKKHFQIP